MPFVSVTRLRIRSWRFLPGFALMALGSQKQVQSAVGFRGGALLPDRRWTFWTLTAWDSEADMRAYMTTGDHRRAMPKLVTWCDEASVVHWEQPHDQLPTWATAAERMRLEGRPSKVRFASAGHAAMDFDAPRTTVGAPIPVRRV
jgi:Domain of unknown function (DUF3291)